MKKKKKKNKKIYHIDRLEKKNQMIISIDANKAFDKIQHKSMKKTQETRKRELQLDEEQLQKPVANIHGERLNASKKTRKGCPPSSLL